jgi:hypothetical protein
VHHIIPFVKRISLAYDPLLISSYYLQAKT